VKRVYFCAVLFIALITFASLTGVYVRGKIAEVRDIIVLIEQEQAEGGSVLYAKSALKKWDDFRKKAWLLSNKQLVAEITASLARIDAAVTRDKDGALQECAAAKKFIEHLMVDNSFAL